MTNVQGDQVLPVRATTHILLGMAAAGAVAGPQRPLALVAGAVAGVLPDAIDWWQRQVFRQPGITVTPDPLAAKPAIMAEGVRLAMQQVRASGRPCVVRFNPLPAREGGYTPYHLDCDGEHRLVVMLAPGGKPVPVDPPGSTGNSAETFAALHPLPLCVSDTPRDLLLSIDGRRIQSRDLDGVAGVGHSLLTAGLLSGIAFACGRWVGIAAAAALAVHLLLDLGGRREWTPWAPLAAKPWPGRRLWNEQGWPANLVAAILAAGIVLAVVLSGRA